VGVADAFVGSEAVKPWIDFQADVVCRKVLKIRVTVNRASRKGGSQHRIGQTAIVFLGRLGATTGNEGGKEKVKAMPKPRSSHGSLLGQNQQKYTAWVTDRQVATACEKPPLALIVQQSRVTFAVGGESADSSLSPAA
jgi:hypothetical protein